MRIDVEEICGRLKAIEDQFRSADEANGKLARENAAILKRVVVAEGEALRAHSMLEQSTNDVRELRRLVARKYEFDVEAGVFEELARLSKLRANNVTKETGLDPRETYTRGR